MASFAPWMSPGWSPANGFLIDFSSFTLAQNAVTSPALELLLLLLLLLPPQAPSATAHARTPATTPVFTLNRSSLSGLDRHHRGTGAPLTGEA